MPISAASARVSTLPLAAGSSSLPWRHAASVSGRMKHLPLKVAKPQPCLHRRFAPASCQECVAAASGHGGQVLRTSQYQSEDDEPLWLAVIRDLASGLRSLLTFLSEQPRQLKHLEWTGFHNTLRTATLTLVLVAVFIVVLSSIDAAFSYILSMLLRKSA